jgi:nucleoside-triphosphatase THEP1
MADNIFILTGPVHSGKTTALQAFIKRKPDAGGILSPVIQGRRWFQDIYSGVIFEAEAEEGEASLKIGKYNFSIAAFSRASGILKNSVQTEWIIIDEIGPLELDNQGFAKVLRELVQSKDVQNLLIVVRENLVKEVVEHFGISAYKVCDTEELNSL